MSGHGHGLDQRFGPDRVDGHVARFDDRRTAPTLVPCRRLDSDSDQRTSDDVGRAGRTQRASLATDVEGHIRRNAIWEGGSATAEEWPPSRGEDLVAYHDAYYRPNGAIHGVTGDVKVKELKSKLEAAFCSWRPGDKTPETPKVDGPAKTATRVSSWTARAPRRPCCSFANVSISRNDPDYGRAHGGEPDPGAALLGQAVQNIREKKGFTYGAYSSLSAGRWPALGRERQRQDGGDGAGAVHEFFYEFDRIQADRSTPDELARAKRSLVEGFARTLESPEGILGRSLELVQYGLLRQLLGQVPCSTDAVTAEDVQRVARKYWAGPDSGVSPSASARRSRTA